jgi:hypothetical protein
MMETPREFLPPAATLEEHQKNTPGEPALASRTGQVHTKKAACSRTLRGWNACGNGEAVTLTPFTDARPLRPTGS